MYPFSDAINLLNAYCQQEEILHDSGISEDPWTGGNDPSIKRIRAFQFLGQGVSIQRCHQPIECLLPEQSYGSTAIVKSELSGVEALPPHLRACCAECMPRRRICKRGWRSARLAAIYRELGGVRILPLYLRQGRAEPLSPRGLGYYSSQAAERWTPTIWSRQQPTQCGAEPRGSSR